MIDRMFVCSSSVQLANEVSALKHSLADQEELLATAKQEAETAKQGAEGRIKDIQLRLDAAIKEAAQAKADRDQTRK